jgi:tryptophan synthase alpha subunit
LNLEFASRVVASGASGAIVPDLPVEEAGEWTKATGARTSGIK